MKKTDIDQINTIMKTNGIKALLLLFSTLGLEELKINFNVGNSNALDFRKGKDSYLTKHTNISID